MKRNQKRRDGESFPKWLERLFPLWSKEQKEIVCEMLKAAYIAGVQDMQMIDKRYANQ